ncbi:alpha/beta fold hydrolase [Desertihabitans brevis]|nr:alpha/beta fold hydrolase [Desertihabitans brevis]
MSDAGVTGPRTLLVLLHGLGDTPAGWQPQVGSFPAGQRMAVPWLAGLKPTDRRPFDLDEAVGQVVALAEEHRAARLRLVGHGLGATVALRVAGRHPDLVDRLVLSAPSPTPPRWVLRLQRALVGLAPRPRPGAGLDRDRVRAVLSDLARADPAADLPKVRAPTLVVCGREDRAGLVGARATAARVPGARLELLDGGAHLPSTSPDEFTRLLHEHLAG